MWRATELSNASAWLEDGMSAEAVEAKNFHCKK
jgi:hypothetical protein